MVDITAGRVHATAASAFSSSLQVTHTHSLTHSLPLSLPLRGYVELGNEEGAGVGEGKDSFYHREAHSHTLPPSIPPSPPSQGLRRARE